MKIKVNTTDLIGDLENFPIEVVEKMLQNQYKQLNKIDIAIFQNSKISDAQHGGFQWDTTIEGSEFWFEVIRKKRFNVFFERYAKSNEVCIRGDVNNGKNVIKELESRGGINHHNYFGDVNGQLYFIDPVTNYIVKANENLEIPLQNLLKTVYTEISPGEYAMVELTMGEIAEKFGVDPELLRIKK